MVRKLELGAAVGARSNRWRRPPRTWLNFNDPSVRMVDPTVLPHSGANLTATPAAVADFKAMWQAAVKLMPPVPPPGSCEHPDCQDPGVCGHSKNCSGCEWHGPPTKPGQKPIGQCGRGASGMAPLAAKQLWEQHRNAAAASLLVRPQGGHSCADKARCVGVLVHGNDCVCYGNF